MPHLRDELDRFHRFASERLEKIDEIATLQELLDLYEIEYPSAQRHAEDVAAIRAAVRDMENGDFGIPFEQFLSQLHGGRNEAAS